MKPHVETEETRLRFRWSRRPDWGVEVYDARLGRFLVGQVSPVHEHGSGRSYWSWQIPITPMCATGGRGTGATPREAARQLEAVFPTVVRSTDRFAMRAEDEVIFRAILGLLHTAALDYVLALERGEHIRPISDTDTAGWERWLSEERRRGKRNWISPKDMHEWFGEHWQDPRRPSDRNRLEEGSSSKKVIVPPPRHGFDAVELELGLATEGGARETG